MQINLKAKIKDHTTTYDLHLIHLLTFDFGSADFTFLYLLQYLEIYPVRARLEFIQQSR
jgi:hypothetical protein